MAMMSILGLYRFDPHIFDEFQIPEGLDKETLIGNLLMELAELSILYPSAPMMKYAISKWSAKMLEKWTKLYATTKYEYDPISNYDRTEKWTDTGTRNGTNANTSTDSTATTNTGKDVVSGTSSGTTNGTTTGSDTTTKKVSGYDSEALVTSEEDSGTTNATNNATSSAENSSTTDTSSTGNVKRDTSSTGSNTENNTNTHEGRMYGNIGVTTTQEMIEQERKVVQLVVFDVIIRDFADRFCIGVW